MAIEFKKKSEQRSRKKESKKKLQSMNGIVGIPITKVFQDLESRFKPKDRNEFYRNLLGLDNATSFSENIGNTETPETLIILDGGYEQFWYGMKLNFAENGHTGKYTVPMMPIDTIPLFGLKNGVILSTIVRMSNENNEDKNILN